MKVLNLYACLGGNRLLWDNCEVTAVELDEAAAKLYQERFPNDTVIVADAHQYLLDHYKEFDFIWSSPPCPTHSRIQISQYTRESWIPQYFDMKLYQEIIFLQTFFKGKYCVENVIPYYEPLIAAKKRGRHLYWTNFRLPNVLSDRSNPDLSRTKNVTDVLCKFHNFDFYKYNGKQNRRKMARNLVDYVAGQTIFEAARGIIVNKQNTNQSKLF